MKYLIPLEAILALVLIPALVTAQGTETDATPASENAESVTETEQPATHLEETPPEQVHPEAAQTTSQAAQPEQETLSETVEQVDPPPEADQPEGQTDPPASDEAGEAEEEAPEAETTCSAGGDVTDPTNTTSFIKFVPEYRRFQTPAGSTHAFGARLQPRLGISPNALVFMELPFYYGSNHDIEGMQSAFGMGDIRLQAFGLPYLNPTGKVMGLGVSLDIIAPSGDWAHGLGGGNWAIAPGMMAVFHVLRPLIIAPILSYSASIPAANGPDGDIIHSLRLMAFVIVRLPLGFYAQIIPDYLQPLSGESYTPRFNMEFIVGWQQMGVWSVELRYKREFVGENGLIDQAGVGVTVFF